DMLRKFVGRSPRALPRRTCRQDHGRLQTRRGRAQSPGPTRRSWVSCRSPPTTAGGPGSRCSPVTITSLVTFSCHHEFPKESFGTHYEVAAADVIDHSEFIDMCRAIPETR